MLIGGAVHNFIDGALIGASLVTSVSLGVSAAIAVAAHEVPHEIGDFAVLLHAGYSRSRALALNIACGLASLAGAVGAVLLVDVVPDLLPYLLAVAASSFLYVALSDLVPDLHSTGPSGATAVRQVLLVGLGMGTVLLRSRGVLARGIADLCDVCASEILTKNSAYLCSERWHTP